MNREKSEIGTAEGMRQETITFAEIGRSGAGQLTYRASGAGPTVILVPSLGRGAADFDDLALRLAREGYGVAAIDPVGAGASLGDTSAYDLYDWACDAAAISGPEGAVFVGHAFGNRVVRALAADRPDLVRGLALLAAGGQVPIPPHVAEAIGRAGDLSLTDEVRLEALRIAFFAPGNDPSVWLPGWYPDLMRAELASIARTKDERWKAPPKVPILIVQPAEDTVAPPANSDAIKAALGDAVRIVTIPDAGHALLPEQGELVAMAVLEFLESLRGAPSRAHVEPNASPRCRFPPLRSIP